MPIFSAFREKRFEHGLALLEVETIGRREMDARHGRIGIQKYTKRQNLVVTRFGLNRELYYFPYSKAATKLTEWMIVALFGRSGRR